MKQRFVNVQGLRALAALLVLGLHVNVLEIRFTGNPFLNAFSPIGNWGVDLFFVISGFVMITSTWNDFGTPAISWRFFLRRLTRIYPPYLVILFPIALLYIVAPTMVNDAQAIKPNVIASFLMLPQAGFGLLVVGWTLVYEMFFYVVFALVLAANRRFCLPLMALWGVLTLIAGAIVRPMHNLYFATYTDSIMLEFIFGVGIGYVVATRRIPLVLPCLVLGIAGLVAADLWYVPFNAAHGLGGTLRFLCIGGPMTLFFAGVVGLETQYARTFPGWLIVIGNASYSLYLWHLPLGVFFGRLTGHPALLRNPVAHAAWLVLLTALVLGASILLYNLVERPLLKYFSGKLEPRPLKLPARAVTGQ
jgi:peptidoglycan/LPS O-acetylase OafA/YrhL